jgi:imidazolonepropionase-like amidohydrolase
MKPLRTLPVRLAIISACSIAALVCGSLSNADDRSSDQPQGIRRHVPSTWALTGARVTVRPGETLDGATVLIRNDRIEAVGKAVAIPDDARVVDLTGRHIYAGFFDAMTEQSVEQGSAKSAARYWNSQIRPARRIAAEFKPDSSLNSALRKQGVTTRLAAPSGGILKGFGAVVLTSDVPVQHAIVRADATQHARLTASRNGTRTYPNSPMGAVALARQSLYDAQWYEVAWQMAKANSKLSRPERNEDLAALNELRTGNVPLIVDTSNELFFLRADRFATEFGLRLIVHGSGNEYRRLDAIQKTGRSVLLPVNFPKPPNVATFEAALDVTTVSLLHWDHAPENPKRLAEAGVTFAFCSTGLSDKGSFLKQIRKAVSRGLSETAALRALTTTPATLFDVEDQLGTIESGRLASLVISDKPIFEDDAKTVETWVAGERFEFTSPPQKDVPGNWLVELTKPREGLPSPLEIRLKKNGENKLTGSLRRETKDDTGENIELGRVALNETRLSLTFRSDAIGLEGVSLLTAVVSPDGKSALGQIVWPGGTRSPVILKRKEDPPKPPRQQPPMPETKGKNEKPAEKTVEEKPAKKASSFPVNFPLGAYGVSSIPMQSRIVAFQNATVWTCGERGILKNATVLIRDGKVWKVGRKVKVPKKARVVDATGMHISPGIIDCHSHFATDGGVNESGQAVTAEVRIGDFVDCDDINIYRQLAGGVTSSNILHGSANPIGGQNQVVKLRWGALGEEMKFKRAPAGIKFALGENVKQSNWGDEYTTRYPQTRMGVEQIFRDEFQAAIEYRQRHESWLRTRKGLPPRRDLELDAIVQILDGRRWIHCHSYRQDEILALIRVLDDFKIRIGTFQHILEGYKVADAMAKHGAMGSAFSDWWAYKFEVYDAIPYAGALMHNAGVVVSFNSDDRELARHLNHEAAKAVKYGGVPPEEALKFVTLNPAKQLRIDRHVGSLEPGKDADLVLWSSSPLSTMSRCEQTWIDGRLYFDRKQDVDLRKENQQIRLALIQKILDSGEPMRKPGEGDVDPASLWPREDLFCHGHGHDHHHEK